jgi:hypothetical protein
MGGPGVTFPATVRPNNADRPLILERQRHRVDDDRPLKLRLERVSASETH